MTVSIVNRTSQSLPLFTGRWHGVAVTEGIYGFPSRIGLQCNDKLEPRNPSVKNQRFLPAPFTQGSLGRCRDCASLTLYTREPLASPFGRGARRAEMPSQSAKLTAPPKGEPRALPRQFNKQQFARGNDTEHPPMVFRRLQTVVTNLQPAMPANSNLSHTDGTR